MQRDLLQRLMDQAFLYDDPTAYQAGVQAAWRALSAEQRDRRQEDLASAEPLVSSGVSTAAG